MSTIDEEVPLLNNPNIKIELCKKDKVSKLSVSTGLGLFVILVGSVLIRQPYSIFFYHPFFMTLFIILATEGVSLLQPTNTPKEKKVGLKYHAMIQTISYLSAITGFSIIFYNKILQGKPHFESLHGKLGLFVFIYLLIQLVFGITIGFVPRLYGSIEKAKSLWRFHRVLGYVLLTLVWITAQLGVRAHYMEMYLYSPHLLWFHWLVVILVFGGILTGIRVRKWGIQR